MPDRPDFWSRRRRAVAAEKAVEEAVGEAAATAPANPGGAEAPADRSDAELLEMFGLPDPDTLTPADAARFMAREIPARLRRRAIRSLFRNHPELSMPDGLQDYDHDYTDAAVNRRPPATAWRGGERLEAAARREIVGASGEAGAEAPQAAEAPAEAAAPIREEPEELLAEADADLPEPGPDDPPRPRRMVFRFEGAAS